MIHRNKKERNFVTLDKTALNDTSLSWAAKGLHSYLMGLPDDWRVNLEDLTRRALDGKHSATTAMNELIRAGYVVRRKVVNAKNQFAGYEYQMFETPQEAEAWGAVHGKTVVGKPDYGKSEHGESVNGKSRTTKVLSNQSIDLLSIEETSIEEMPARESAASVKVTKGQPVIDFEGQTTLLDLRTGAEITGAETPKTGKTKRAKNGETMLSDVYTREGFVEAWNWTPFAKARITTVDAGRLYDRMEAWCSSRPNTNKRTDWLAAGRTFVLNAERDGKPREFAPRQETAAEQFEQQTGIQLTPTQQKLANFASELKAKRGGAEV